MDKPKATPKEIKKMTPEEVFDTTGKIVAIISGLRGKGVKSFTALTNGVTQAITEGLVLDRDFQDARDAALDRMIQDSVERARQAAQEKSALSALPKEPAVVTMVGVLHGKNRTEIKDGEIVRSDRYKQIIRPGAFSHQPLPPDHPKFVDLKKLSAGDRD